MADVYEIIDTILKLKGIERAEVVAVQDAKRKKRGGFDDRLLMLDKTV
jgi:predicted house-cleaning noncanonical NTP pyrophosphatase (MazG superfamily)